MPVKNNIRGVGGGGVAQPSRRLSHPTAPLLDPLPATRCGPRHHQPVSLTAVHCTVSCGGTSVTPPRHNSRAGVRPSVRPPHQLTQWLRCQLNPNGDETNRGGLGGAAKAVAVAVAVDGGGLWLWGWRRKAVEEAKAVDGGSGGGGGGSDSGGGNGRKG